MNYLKLFFTSKSFSSFLDVFNGMLAMIIGFNIIGKLNPIIHIYSVKDIISFHMGWLLIGLAVHYTIRTIVVLTAVFITFIIEKVKAYKQKKLHLIKKDLLNKKRG